MSLRLTRRLVALSALALPAACSLVDSMDGYSAGKASGDAGPLIDSGIDATEAPCGEGSKSCGAACAPFAASNGCGAPGCGPCPAYANAAGTGTAAGACALGPCVTGFADCDGNAANGCETQLDDDPANCGACGHACSLPNATAKCAGSACAIDTCATDYGDCNKDPSDGCETSTSSDVAHCGACDTPCPTVASATFACEGSACAIASCAAGALSCDGTPTNGCECALPNATVSCSPSATVADAGADAALDGSVLDAGGGDAATGLAGCYFAQCVAPFEDCDGNRANGCEADLTTSATDCGACGFSCGGGTCLAGRCQPVQIIGSQGNPGELAIDRDYAYWTNYGAGTILGSVYSVRKDGANPTPIAGGSDSSQNGAWGIATSFTSSAVYWTTYESASHVGSAFKVGGSVSSLQTTTGHLRGAVLDGNYLYYANYEANTVVRLDVTQATPTAETVASAPTIQRPNTLAADGTSIYVVNEGTPTTTGTSIGSASSTGTVIAIDKTTIGGTLAVTTLASTLDRPRGLAVDATQVYWSNAGSTANAGSVQKLVKGTMTPITLATGLTAPREIAICQAAPSTPTECDSDPYLYVTEYSSGFVERVRKDATGPKAPFHIATGQASPLGIAVDSQYVFWADYGTSGVVGGSIMRLVKQP